VHNRKPALDAKRVIPTSFSIPNRGMGIHKEGYSPARPRTIINRTMIREDNTPLPRTGELKKSETVFEMALDKLKIFSRH
jgi:hypothetical protein